MPFGVMRSRCERAELVCLAFEAYAAQSAREHAATQWAHLITAIGGAARTPETLSTHLRRPKHCASHVYAACEAVAWSTYFRVIVRRHQAVVRGAGASQTVFGGRHHTVVGGAPQRRR